MWNEPRWEKMKTMSVWCYGRQAKEWLHQIFQRNEYVQKSLLVSAYEHR